MHAQLHYEYDKHFEVRNRWTNQNISKYYKNHKYNDSNGRWIEPRKKYSRFDLEFDLEDHQQPYIPNIIPVWDCPRCTYKNIERKTHCNMCNISYSVSNRTPKQSNQPQSMNPSDIPITLGDFCKEMLDTLSMDSIPVWICSQCTYCNIEQLPKCKICHHPYSAKQSGQHNEYIMETDEDLQFVSTETVKYDIDYDEDMNYKYNDDITDLKEINNDHTVNSKIKHEYNEQENVDKIRLEVIMKLCPNRIYSAKLPSFNKEIEDLAHHTLIECELNCYGPRSLEPLSSTKLIPCICYRNEYKPLDYKVIVPIQYAYKRHTYFKRAIKQQYQCNGHWREKHHSRCKVAARFDGWYRSDLRNYTFNNNPLASIAQYIWNARYPELNQERKWRFIMNENDDNYYSPVHSAQLLELLLIFIPSKDVLNHILFAYLGYDQIDIVKMNSDLLMLSEGFNNIKLHHIEKKLFQRKYGYLPFIIYDTMYSKIRQRNCYNFQLFEIGYHKKHIVKKYTPNTAPVKPNEVQVVIKTKADRKEAKRLSFKKRNIKQFYPRKYLQLKLKADQHSYMYNDDGTKKSLNRIRRMRIERISKKRQKRKGIDQWRYTEWKKGWNLYIGDNKWSAYWKLQQYLVPRHRVYLIKRNVKYETKLLQNMADYIERKWHKHFKELQDEYEKRNRHKFEDEDELKEFALALSKPRDVCIFVTNSTKCSFVYL